jgi:demethylmenaquinone methyltransferase/2-methoxy-6-polyprenyl-1,4-benzoquinol methylase
MPNTFADLKSQSIDGAERQKYVAGLFDKLAPRYDRFNRWVSFFRDEAWRRETVSLLNDRKTGVLLDLAAGTGDLAHHAAKRGANSVNVFDISHEMLLLAKAKLPAANGVSSSFAFQQGSAHQLPFKDNSIDGIVSGFAMRNVFHFLDDVLLEMQRVLKPGGRFAILELSRPQNALLRMGFRLHMKTVMPMIGKLATGDWAPFHYLYQTTMTFLSPAEFKQRLEKAGLAQVDFKRFLFGGIAIHYGEKSA